MSRLYFQKIDKRNCDKDLSLFQLLQFLVPKVVIIQEKGCAGLSSKGHQYE